MIRLHSGIQYGDIVYQLIIFFLIFISIAFIIVKNVTNSKQKKQLETISRKLDQIIENQKK
jgi:large-conductance mechanosensitive channel